MGIEREPNEGHQRLMADMHRICDQAEANGIPRIEQIAMLAQLIGQHIHHLPPTAGYTPQSLLQSVMLNIHKGNQTASGAGLHDLIATDVAGHG